MLTIALSVQTAFTSGTGAPAGHTGSPGDGMNCTACHSGSPTTLTNLITSNIPASGYVPGTTYLITATITHPTFNKFGFQISPQNSSGTLMGTIALTMPSATQILNGKWITHTGGGTTGTANSRTWTFNWTAPAAGSGQVTFYGAFNCANNNNNTTGDQIRLSSLTVQQGAAPLVVLASQTNPSCAGPCNGGAGVSVNGGTPPYSVVWSNGSNGLAISNLCAGTYTAVVTDGSGATASQVVTLVSPPPASVNMIVTGGTSICDGDCATLQIPGSFSSYLWSTGATGAQITVCQAGVYSCVATDASGCISNSNSVTITILPTPGIPTITDNGFVLSSTTAFSYQWLLDGSPILGATQQNHTAVVNGNYRVVVGNANGCTDTSAVFVVNSISLDEGNNLNYAAYPNPFSNELVLPGESEGAFRIMDMSGRIILESVIHSNTRIETSEWPSGTYIVEFTDTQANKRYQRVVKP